MGFIQLCFTQFVLIRLVFYTAGFCTFDFKKVGFYKLFTRLVLIWLGFGIVGFLYGWFIILWWFNTIGFLCLGFVVRLVFILLAFHTVGFLYDWVLDDWFFPLLFFAPLVFLHY